MKTRLDLDTDFCLPDSKERNLIAEFCLAVSIGAIGSILLLTAICHHETVSGFFSMMVSNIFFGTPFEKGLSITWFGSIFYLVIKNTILRLVPEDLGRSFMGHRKHRLIIKLRAWYSPFFKPKKI